MGWFGGPPHFRKPSFPKHISILNSCSSPPQRLADEDLSEPPAFLWPEVVILNQLLLDRKKSGRLWKWGKNMEKSQKFQEILWFYVRVVFASSWLFLFTKRYVWREVHGVDHFQIQPKKRNPHSGRQYRLPKLCRFWIFGYWTIIWPR